MSSSEEIGNLKVVVDMDSTGLQSGITNINRQLKIAQSEFQATSSKLGKFGDSAEQLRAKSDLLAKQFDLQKQKVALYEKALENAKNALEKNSNTTAELKKKVQDAKAAYEESNKSLGENSEETKKLKTELEKLNKEYDSSKSKVSNSERSIDNYTIKLNKARSSLSNVQNDLNATNSAIEKQSNKWLQLSEKIEASSAKMKAAGEKMSSVGSKLTIGVTTPLMAAGFGFSKLAMDSVESENLFEVSMGSMAESARQWSEQLRSQLGLNAYEVRKNVGTFNVMFDSMGIGTQKAYDMSKGLTQLAYDMASFYNLPVERAFEKLRSGISGEAEPLKQLGININETAVETYALQHGITKLTPALDENGKAVYDNTGKIKMQKSEMTEAEKVTARYGLILERTSKAQGDMARTLDSPANKARILKEEAKNAATEFGKSLIPMAEKLMSKIEPLVKGFSNMSEGEREFVIVAATTTAAMGPLIMGTGKLFEGISQVGKGFSWSIKFFKDVSMISKGTASSLEGVSLGAKALGAVLSGISFGPFIIGIGAVAAAAGSAIIILNSFEKKRAQIESNMTKEIETEKDKRLKAIDDESNAKIESLQSKASAEEAAIQESMQRIQKERKAHVDAGKDVTSNLKEELQKRKEALEQQHSDTIQKIRDYYGVAEEKSHSLTDVVREDAEKQKQAIQDVYDAKLKLLEEETDSRVKSIENQIKQIDNATKFEDAADRDTKEQEKIRTLQSQLLAAKDADEKKRIAQDLADTQKEIERRKLLEERELQKQALQAQIEAIKKDSESRANILKSDLEREKLLIDKQTETKIAQIQRERKEKEDAENLKYNAEKQSLENQLKELEKYSKTYSSTLESEVDAKLDAENKKLTAVRERLAKEQEAITAAAEERKRKEEAEAEDSVKKAKETAQKMANAEKSQFFQGVAMNSWNAGSLGQYLGEYLAKIVLGRNAAGTNFWKGGLTTVNEEGYEVIDLPRGSRVLNHDASVDLINKMAGQNQGGYNGPLFVIQNFNNYTDKDLETLMYEAEYARQRAAIAIGGGRR